MFPPGVRYCIPPAAVLGALFSIRTLFRLFNRHRGRYAERVIADSKFPDYLRELKQRYVLLQIRLSLKDIVRGLSFSRIASRAMIVHIAVQNLVIVNLIERM